MSNLLRRSAGVCAAALAATLLAVPGLANASGIKIYSYAVKFICEEEEGNEVDTSINIHNPSLTGNADFILKLVAPDYGFQVFDFGYLRADTGTSRDCDDVFGDQVAVATIDPSDFEGFVVVLSKKPLDVVGVYEVEHTGNGEEVEDLDVVVYQPQIQTVPATVWGSLLPN